MQVHHDLWHHSRLGRERSWFPRLDAEQRPLLNGAGGSGAAPGRSGGGSSEPARQQDKVRPMCMVFVLAHGVAPRRAETAAARVACEDAAERPDQGADQPLPVHYC